MPRYFLHLAYDGTDYSGWQVQPGVATVQETVNEVLKILLPDAKGLMGCGRTDAGVHASDFYAHFESELELPEEFLYKMNAILPLDIVIKDVFKVAAKTHARFNATERGYEYYVHFKKSPFRNRYSVFQPAKLDMERVGEACKYLIGKKDFTSFSRSQTQTKTNLCEIKYAFWEQFADGAVFKIGANRFLRNMVRAIVGTLYMVGEEKIEPAQISDIIEAKDRRAAGKSAHPQGLFLSNIFYPEIHGPRNR